MQHLYFMDHIPPLHLVPLVLNGQGGSLNQNQALCLNLVFLQKFMSLVGQKYWPKLGHYRWPLTIEHEYQPNYLYKAESKRSQTLRFSSAPASWTSILFLDQPDR